MLAKGAFIFCAFHSRACITLKNSLRTQTYFRLLRSFAFAWLENAKKKCFFHRLDKTHYRIRLPIRSCIPVRAGYVDTSYSRLSAFLPSVAFRTTNRYTVSFICCLKCISTWIRAYLKETYQVYTQICSEWVSASLLVQASFPQCYSHLPITREKRPLLAGKVAAYSPIFRGCFRVAGYSSVKPKSQDGKAKCQKILAFVLLSAA